MWTVTRVTTSKGSAPETTVIPLPFDPTTPTTEHDFGRDTKLPIPQRISSTLISRKQFSLVVVEGGAGLRIKHCGRNATIVNSVPLTEGETTLTPLHPGDTISIVDVHNKELPSFLVGKGGEEGFAPTTMPIPTTTTSSPTAVTWWWKSAVNRDDNDPRAWKPYNPMEGARIESAFSAGQDEINLNDEYTVVF
eukprot:PhF_6_TR27944/c0_g2_i2/m.41198